MANLASWWAQKWANFFIAVPKFHPQQKDPKRVLSAGAWGLVPKSAVSGPPNTEIRNLQPPKFGKKNFRTCTIQFPKVHPERPLTHLHQPMSDQNCPITPGPHFFPMWTCHVWPAKQLAAVRAWLISKQQGANLR